MSQAKCPKCGKAHEALTPDGKRRCQKHRTKARTEDGQLIQCSAKALKGRDWCKNHGGRAVEGVGHPNYKDGRHMKRIPKEWAREAQARLKDPALLSLLPNIVISDARIDAALDVLNRSEIHEAWKRVVELEAEMAREGNADKRALLLAQLLTVIRNGKQIAEALAELDYLTEQRRRLVETEVKRQSAEHQSLSYDRVIALTTMMLDIVMRHIPEIDRRREIIADWRAAATYKLLPPGESEDAEDG